MSQICALKRITTKDQRINDKFSQIQLKSDSNQIYIGRDVDCNYRISSIEISRKHALLEYSSDDNFWTISDLNSTNGLFVNSVQLQPYNPYRLVNGDKVSFGPPNQSQFCYQFVDNSVYELPTIGLTAIPVIPIVTRIQTSSTSESVLTSGLHIGIGANQSRTISLTSTMPTRSGLNYAVSTTRAPRTSVGNSSAVSSHKKMSGHRKASAESAERQTLTDHDYSRNSSSANKMRKSLSKRLKLKDNTRHKKTHSKMSESERKHIAKEREELEKSKNALEEQNNKDREKIKKKEENLKKKQKELLRKEREAKKREQEIESMRKELMKEKSLLEKKREEFARTEKRKLRSSPVSGANGNESKRQCKDQKNVIEDLLESELICSICSEYFIQAVNLNCSHTFCEHCIEEWKRQNEDEAFCPICRHPIENQNRQLVLDNLIDQFVRQTKPSLIDHRDKVTEERKKKMAKKVSHSHTSGTSAVISWSTDGSDSDSDSESVSSDDSSGSSVSARLISGHRFFVDSNSWANLSIDVFDVSDVSDEFEMTSSLSSWSSDNSDDSDSDDSIEDNSSTNSGSDSDDSELSVLTVDD